MTDFAHEGSESVEACGRLCLADAHCTCFIHTDRPDPAGGFAACKTVNHSVVGLEATARGYSAYVRSASAPDPQ